MSKETETSTPAARRRRFAYEFHKPRLDASAKQGVKTYRGYPELMRQKFVFPSDSYSLFIHRVRHKIFTNLKQEMVFQANHPRLHYCIVGRGTLVSEDRTVEYRPGRLFTLSRETGAYRAREKAGEFESFFMEFDIEDHVFRESRIEEIRSVRAVRVPSLYVDLPAARRALFEAELFRLVEIMYDRPPSYPFRARQQLLAILSLCLEWDYVRLVNLRKENVDTQWHHYLWVEKAKRFMHEQYPGKLSLRDIGQHVGVDPGYLNQIFQRESGLTLNQYLNDVRIQKAKSLMADGVTHVTDIALQTGFQTSSYFSKCFRTATGTSPSAYIRGL
ncbi:MAG: helix-turn-helix transcriptional regulator [Kiritimatiellae bacterium]|nr:helix-turn-helix transcriptional regulator [Kiritimatiellia bacterium]